MRGLRGVPACFRVGADYLARCLLRVVVRRAFAVPPLDNVLSLLVRLNTDTNTQSLYKDDGASLDDLREAVATLEDAGQIARRVMGGAHPTTAVIGRALQNARAALGAREAA